MKSELKQKADNAYCAYSRALDRPECLGVEHKIEHGLFTKDNLKALTDAYTLYGKHLAYHDCMAMEKAFSDFRKETADTMTDLLKQLDHLKEIA